MAEWVPVGHATHFPENSLEVPHTQPADAQSTTWLFRPSSDSSRAPALSSPADGLIREMPGLPETCVYFKPSLLSQLH